MKSSRIDLLAIAILVFSAVALAWLPVAYGTFKDAKPADWLGFLGNVFGAGMTVAAAVFAWIAVGRQIRMEIVSREEDRQERLVPALRAAEDKIDWFLTEILDPETGQPVGWEDIARIIRNYGISSEFGELVLRLESDLPNTDDTLRRQIAEQFVLLHQSFDLLRSHKMSAVSATADWAALDRSRTKFFSDRITDIQNLRSSILKKRLASQKRRDRLREELEVYFDR